VLIPDQNVFGWSRQILGGSFGTGNAVVESVATIPSPDESHDQTWAIVKRTINGATKRYVEFFEDIFEEATDITDAYFVDSGITYDSTAATSITGLDHLEGETVSILADGMVAPDQMVVNGAVTLATAASTVQVGLAYNADIETLNLEANTQQGTRQGKLSRIARLAVRLHNTVGGKCGRDADNLDVLPGRTSATPMGTPVQPFTGDVAVPFNGGYEAEATMYFRQDQPLPMTILAVMPEVGTGARS
jgi:hypothetical protein